MRRVLMSLDGLSVGDGFGDSFFTAPDIIARRVRRRELPEIPWRVTDDTIMALSIVRSLRLHGGIDQDFLAMSFAQEFRSEPGRGYGGMAQQILNAISEGASWKEVSRHAFGGQGSCGNGGAMRSAPIGAYFADDTARLVYEAKLSAEVTHAHPDGKTGAAAVALAAAWMIRDGRPAATAGHALIEFVLEHLPRTETFEALNRALAVPLTETPERAAAILGSGSRVISSDTVPFCLWCAARHAGDFVEAMWTTVRGLGDRDTTCAIVGGIVAAGLSPGGIPEHWITAREEIAI